MKATVILLCFLAVVLCGKFSLKLTPKEWSRYEISSLETPVSFTLHLERRNIPLLKEIYDNVTNPLHPNWRKFLSAEEVFQLTKPSEDAYRQFDKWIESFPKGKQLSVVKNAYSIEISTTVGVASELLQVPFHEYQHTSSHKLIRIRGTAQIPTNLESKIESISGLTDLILAKKHIQKIPENHLENRQTKPSPTVTPAILKQAYGINYVATPVNAGSLQAIVGLNDSFSVNALNAFRTNFNLAPITVGFPYGANCIPNCDQAESNLDVQYITATGDGIPTIFINRPTLALSEFNVAYGYLDGLATANLPKVVSLSYGGSENNLYSKANGYASIVTTLETTFMSLGVKGVSLFVSSGDGGVSGSLTSFTGAACDFAPSFPAISPYVTAVGATQLVGTGTQTSWTEVVAQTTSGAVINSGGGFSWGHTAPTWQTAAIAAWQAVGDPNVAATAYFGTNRGIPDISLAGHLYEVYGDAAGGGVAAGGYDGTSASSPALAGMISLINNALLNAGKAPLGPLNPYIYNLYSTSAATTFNAVVSGTNPCLPSRSACCSTAPNTIGFTDITTTWNPAIGLGTPQFTPLMNALLNGAPATSAQATGTSAQATGTSARVTSAQVTSQQGGTTIVTKAAAVSTSFMATLLGFCFAVAILI